MIISYKCPNCGDDMVFDSSSGMLTCHSCGRQDQIESLPKEYITTRFSENEANEYRCENCGAVLMTEAETTATTCGFCGGAAVLAAASLPKIAILLSAMDAIEKGELTETPEVKKDMRLMISKSDNAASTRMIDRIGYEKIESVMTDPNYEFYDENSGGGLWVGKRYGGGGDTNREPLKQLSHAASVTQVCRFYYLLANGKLVNEKRSKQMLSIMENPELHHKFVNTLDMIAPTARLFRKSGSWKTYHSDSILVWGKESNRRYILVALVDDPDGEQIIRNLVKPVEKVLKKPEI